MKKFLALLLTGALLLLTGCGHVASEKTLRRMAKKNGDCEFLYSEESDEKRTCYFRDELGFEYYISSYMSDMTIDGASFGSYESKSSNYETQYMEYVKSKVTENTPQDLFLSFGDNSWIRLISQETLPQERLESEALILGREFYKQDVRHLLKEDHIEVYVKDDMVGCYYQPLDKFLDKTETRWLYYRDRLIEYGIEDAKDVQFIRYDHLDWDELPELHSFSLVNILGNPDPVTEGLDVYYFSYKGQEHFITNVVVSDKSVSGTGWFYNDLVQYPYDKED